MIFIGLIPEKAFGVHEKNDSNKASFNTFNFQSVDMYRFFELPRTYGFVPRDNTTFQFKDAKTTEDGSPIVENISYLFAGESKLENNTDTEQTLSTNEFSKTFTTTVSNSVTHGTEVDADITSSFNIPLIGGSELSLSASYNFSNTETKEKSKEVTYTANSQSIVVPPRTTYRVKVRLKTMELVGNVKLSAIGLGSIRKVEFATLSGPNLVKDVSAKDFLRVRSKNWNILQQLWPEVAKAPISDKGNGTFELNGKGTYTDEYGSEFEVTVYEEMTGSAVSNYKIPILQSLK